MIQLQRFDIDKRYQSIPAPIRELSRDNVLVYDMVNRYVNGQIVTYEEFLHQTILGLAENWSKMMKDYIDFRAMTVFPVIVPKQP